MISRNSKNFFFNLTKKNLFLKKDEVIFRNREKCTKNKINKNEILNNFKRNPTLFLKKQKRKTKMK